MSESEKIEGCDKEAFESWNCEKKAMAVPGDRNWPEKALGVPIKFSADY